MDTLQQQEHGLVVELLNLHGAVGRIAFGEAREQVLRQAPCGRRPRIDVKPDAGFDERNASQMCHFDIVHLEPLNDRTTARLV
eukprot:COSAG01_NODE_43083_length_433_cov_1.173653_1_plen_83_part_00